MLLYLVLIHNNCITITNRNALIGNHKKLLSVINAEL